MQTHRDIILQGDALIADIDACAAPRGRLGLWWLGQHSFIVKAGDAVIYIDPFLSPMQERLCPPLLTPAQIRHAAFICGTHDHADHVDRPVWPALAKASPGARFVVPRLLLDRGLAAELGIDAGRFVGLDDGGRIEVESSGSDRKSTIHICAVAAAHEFLDRDPASGRYPYLGFIIEANGCTLYHAGDTVWYDGLQTKLRRWAFDAMLVPINGRDATRLRNNILGNMIYQEAADLCGPLISHTPGVVIPAHYDMFAGNPGDVEGFLDYMATKYPAAHALRCRYGERVMIGKQ
jgi:L-ascorbate metabolism protein UlaG (beta-lactamase superfamily)